MKLYAKLLTLVAAIGLVVTTTSCTPEEAALGGALIGAGTAIAIVNESHHRYGYGGYGYGGYGGYGGYRCY